MPRAVNGTVTRNRRKKILKLAKGFRGSRGNLYRKARESVEKALSYSYRDRRNKKRDFRRLWIARINAASRDMDIPYSKLIKSLDEKNIKINRKILSDISINDNATFQKVVKVAIG